MRPCQSLRTRQNFSTHASLPEAGTHAADLLSRMLRLRLNASPWLTSHWRRRTCTAHQQRHQFAVCLHSRDERRRQGKANAEGVECELGHAGTRLDVATEISHLKKLAANSPLWSQYWPSSFDRPNWKDDLARPVRNCWPHHSVHYRLPNSSDLFHVGR